MEDNIRKLLMNFQMIRLIIIGLVILTGCKTYKRLESFDQHKITISLNSDSALHNAFKVGIKNQDDFLSLDTCRKAKYEIKQIKGPYFSNHHIFIDKEKFSLSLSNPTPIILYNGNIYYSEKHHFATQKIDSIDVIKVIINLLPCSQ